MLRKVNTFQKINMLSDELEKHYTGRPAALHTSMDQTSIHWRNDGSFEGNDQGDETETMGEECILIRSFGIRTKISRG